QAEGMKAQSPARLMSTRGCSAMASKIGFFPTRCRISSSPSRTNWVGTTTGTTRPLPVATRWPNPCETTKSRHSASPQPASTFAMYIYLLRIARHEPRPRVRKALGRRWLRSHVHLAHDRKGPDDDSGRASQNWDIAHGDLATAHDGDSGDLDVDALGSDDVVLSHDPDCGNDEIGAVDLGSAQIDMTLAHHSDDASVSSEAPAPLRLRLAHHSDDPTPGAPSQQIGGRLRQNGQIREHGLQLSFG